MTELTVVDRNLVADAVEARLRALVLNVAGYVGEPSKVPLKPNGDGRVAPYWVLHTSTGAPTGEDDLGETAIDLDTWWQINCAGDSEYDVRGLITMVDASMYRWRPVIAGYQCGLVKPPPGFITTIRPDKTEKPHRFVAPLQYALVVHT